MPGTFPNISVRWRSGLCVQLSVFGWRYLWPNHISQPRPTSATTK